MSAEPDYEIAKRKYSLFSKRCFLPIFLATFLGALNDNILRSGLIILIAYSAIRGIELPMSPTIMVTLCSALLVLPIILFSSIAGSLADKYDKSKLVIYAKIAELFIMLVSFYGFAENNIYLLMAMLFLSGTHTAFYSPIKFSILPDHLHNKELLAGNGFVAGGSYVAVFMGLITGGIMVEMHGNVIGNVLLAVAILGFIASLFIPPSKIASPGIDVDLNIWRGTIAIIHYVWEDRQTMHNILALSFFMLFSFIYMSQFANYAQSVVQANNEVYILFLVLFTIGLAIGSLLCDSLLGGKISAKLTPIAALGLSAFTYLMIFATPVPAHEGLINFYVFIAMSEQWLMLGSMVLVALCGGIYIVPLYALLQTRADEEYRSRVIAASNLSDAIFMTLAAIISALLLMAGFSIKDLFILVATLNLFVVWHARKIST